MRRFFHLLLCLFIIGACQTPRSAIQSDSDDGQIEVQFLQINDVYEIDALEGGKVGGMARIATLRNQLLQQNSNTLTVHAGDFLNPSLIGTLRYEGERIKGRQMVEVMNASGVDVVAFGNHEFDLDEEELQARLNESTFRWLGTNVLHVKSQLEGQLILEPFYKLQNGQQQFVPETWIWSVQDTDGTSLKVGFFSATLPSNPKDYVYYEDAYQEAVKAYLSLAPKVDVVVGLTHQELIQDMKLASLLPKVPLLMGGHEHENLLDTIGKVVIAKADANAKTAWVHRLQFDKKHSTVKLRSELVAVDEAITADTKVATLVEKWNTILNENIADLVDEPAAVIYTATTPLDGREKSVRNQQTNFGQLITAAMADAATQQVDAAIINGGAIRLDDQLSGDITAIDIFRALPFGGDIKEVELTGSLLQEVLDAGLKNKGLGGYLQRHTAIENGGDHWVINGKTLANEQTYRIMVLGFLLTGLETNLDFFTPDNPGILSIDEASANATDDNRTDVRKTIVAYLKTL